MDHQDPVQLEEPDRDAARCLTCGYLLRGHPDRGTCPECGEAYSKDVIDAGGALPSPLGVAARFGWPVALFALLSFWMPVAGPDGVGVGFFVLGPVLIVAILVNTIVQTVICLRRLRHRLHAYDRAIEERMRVIGFVIALCIVAVILIPAVCFGVCLDRVGF